MVNSIGYAERTIIMVLAIIVGGAYQNS